MRFLHLSIFGSLVPPSRESCLCNKSHRLPFGESTLKSSSPFELVYSDEWGPSPVTSLDGYKYYMIFVDHFTEYIWLYPLRFKSDVFDTFVQFKNNVENYFKTIVSVYTDGGGEFIKLKDFFLKCGISHLYTPPYTLQHNGIVERRHRHIVETGITLLHQASLPPKFWSFAFQTAVYLINRLPSRTTGMQCPFQLLFKETSNYNKLKIFGCLCYP